MKLLFRKNKLMFSPARVFHKNSLIVACCTFGKLEIRTLTPNRSKNQTNDTLKLLDCHCNNKQGLVKQKTVPFHHCGVQLEFPLHFY